MGKEREIELETLYMGGGTPSIMTSMQLSRVINTIKKHTGQWKNCELTVEMDPGTFSKEKLQEYQELGVSRISMGIQTFQKNEFSSLGRGHSFSQVMQSLDIILESGFNLDQVSIDLMLGIPY